MIRSGLTYSKHCEDSSNDQKVTVLPVLNIVRNHVEEVVVVERPSAVKVILLGAQVVELEGRAIRNLTKDTQKTVTYCSPKPQNPVLFSILIQIK